MSGSGRTNVPIPAFLHPFYGAIFPATVLVIAHVLARGLDDEKDRWKVFAMAAFFRVEPPEQLQCFGPGEE